MAETYPEGASVGTSTPPHAVLSERHLALFGTIVQWFARYELTMQQAMARLAGTDLECIAILTHALDFAGKRSALLKLLRERGTPSDRWEHVNACLTMPAALLHLRDDICHATWMASRLPSSVQPNWILQIKPGVEPNRPGTSTDGVSYTLDALAEIAGNLADNHARLLSYLGEMRLM
jgi:hypothetical protein